MWSRRIRSRANGTWTTPTRARARGCSHRPQLGIESVVLRAGAFKVEGRVEQGAGRASKDVGRSIPVASGEAKPRRLRGRWSTVSSGIVTWRAVAGQAGRGTMRGGTRRRPIGCPGPSAVAGASSAPQKRVADDASATVRPRGASNLGLARHRHRADGRKGERQRGSNRRAGHWTLEAARRSQPVEGQLAPWLDKGYPCLKCSRSSEP